jgi:hypothetical protein
MQQIRMALSGRVPNLSSESELMTPCYIPAMEWPQDSRGSFLCCKSKKTLISTCLVLTGKDGHK